MVEEYKQLTGSAALFLHGLAWFRYTLSDLRKLAYNNAALLA